METSYSLIQARCPHLNDTDSLNNYPGVKYFKYNYVIQILYCLIILNIIFSRLFKVQQKDWISVLISLCLFPFLLVICLIFTFYKQLIKLVLRVKLGNRFGGFLDGTDVVWTLEDESKNIINILMIIESKMDTETFCTHFRNSLKKSILRNSTNFSKLLSTYQQSYGYYYISSNNIQVEDCVKLFKTKSNEQEITKQELIEYLNKISNLDLPKSHSAFWEVTIINCKVKWNNKMSFPIIFRVHHSLGDGISLIKVLSELLVKSSSVKTTTCKDRFKENVVNFFSNIHILCSSIFIISQQLFRRPDSNLLHGPILFGQKILINKSETKTSKVALIKQIKKCLPGVRFSDILLAAISKSFLSYYEQNFSTIPDFITTVVVAYPYTTANVANLKLQNNFSLALLDLPIGGTAKSNFANTAKIINGEANKLVRLNAYKVNHCLISFACSLLPVPLLKSLVKSNQATLVVSNLPGPPSMTIFGDCKLQDLFFFVPNRGTTGVGISVLTFDNRLNLGLNVDKALISNNKDVQVIVDDIYKNIELMYSEIKNEKLVK